MNPGSWGGPRGSEWAALAPVAHLPTVPLIAGGQLLGTPRHVLSPLLWQTGSPGSPGWSFADRLSRLQPGDCQLWLRQGLPQGHLEEGHVLRRRRLLCGQTSISRCAR